MPDAKSSLAAFSVESWWRELRFAFRSLRRAPGFSLAVFVTFAVCIGPNGAVLSTLYDLVLKPLPFPSPRELVVVQNVADRQGGQVRDASMPQYRDFREHADRFSGFAVVRPENLTVDEDNAPIRLGNDWVSHDFFDVLGVKPTLGRFFTAAEETPGRNMVLVLSHAYWINHYNGDPGIVGRAVRLGGMVYTIVGIAPASLAALSPGTCFYQPYAPSPPRVTPQQRYLGDCILYGRLKPGVTPAAGLAQLTVLEQRFRREVAGPGVRDFAEKAGFRLQALPLRPGGVTDNLKALWLLQAGALLVLLIGGTNVVNLYLARMNARRAELATRVALGAGRAALLRQFLMESLLLAGTAAVAGLAIAWTAIRVFNHFLPIIERTAPPVMLDLPVVAAILAATFLLSVVVAYLPLHVVWQRGLRPGGSRTVSAGGAVRKLSGQLVSAQVAIAVVLLVGAGLLIRSFYNVTSVRLGFDASRVVQGRLVLVGTDPNPAAILARQRQVIEAFRRIPGVEHVALVGGYALDPDMRSNPLILRGATAGTGDTQPLVCAYPASPEFFATMGIRLLEGRVFNDADDDFTKHPVVIVDEAFVDRYLRGQATAIGQELTLGTTPPPGDYVWPRIVGVVARANLSGLEQRDSPPIVYVPMVGWPTAGFNVVVRSARPPAEVIGDMRRALRDVDPRIPLYLTQSLQEGIESMLMPRRGITLLLGVFAGLALLLAGVGLYGVLAYDVSQRTREIGIRGAIGATQGQIVGLILRQGMWKTIVGLAVGIGGALYCTRFLRSQLFDTTQLDPLAYAAVLLILGAVAFLASFLPAWRAAKVDPVTALRAE